MFRQAVAVSVTAASGLVTGLLMTTAPANAGPPAVEVFDVEGPAPIVSTACGFAVTRQLHGTLRTFSAPETPSPLDSHALIQITGTYTGPTGRSFDVSTTNNILVRELADGTLVEVDSGRTLSFVGHAYDLGGEAETVHGQSIEATSYCDLLAP
jgi:hypothetical protein